MNVMSAGLLGEIMAVQIMNEVDKPEKLINQCVNSRIIQQFNSLFEILHAVLIKHFHFQMY